MRKRKALFVSLIAVSLCLIGAAYVMREQWFDGRLGGIVMGTASALTSISVVQLLVMWQEDENPKIRKQNEIDQKDERNQAVRNRAKALSGTVLQCTVLAAGWIAFGLDAPAWILLLATGAFIAKGILDLCLIAYFQGVM